MCVLPLKPVLGGVDSVASFILLSMNRLNQTQTAVFTPLLHLLLPEDHITRIYRYHYRLLLNAATIELQKAPRGDLYNTIVLQ